MSLIGIIFLNFYSLLMFFTMRFFMQNAYILEEESKLYSSDILKMYQQGFAYDLRATTMAFVLCILLFYLALLSKKLHFSFLVNLFKKLYYAWAFFALFVLCAFAFLGFYYFEAYKSKIDIFIFNLANDDTQAAFKIIFENYPIVWIVLSCFAFAILGVLILMFIDKITGKNPLKTTVYAILNICFLGIYFVGVRGGVGTFPLGENQLNISNLATINHLTANPLIAFSWAHKHNKSMNTFYTVDGEKLNQTYKKLFNENMIKHTPYNEFLEKNPPHVMFNLMESFGTNYLMLEDSEHDFLCSFRKHFKEDFVFTRFLSGHNGTAPSFAGIYYMSAYAHIAQSPKKNIKLAYTPFDVYKKAGYKVIFITSANSSWQGMDGYLRVLGVDEIYDMNSLMQEFPESKSMLNAYGVPDEFIYKKALKVLKNATKPVFIFTLTTTNHPPFFTPKDFKPNIKIDDEFLSNFDTKSKTFMISSARVYAYANDVFGKFLDEIKSSSLGTHTIIAATGDHKNRDMKKSNIDFMANDFAVPFYIYVPKDYQKDIFYDKSRAGSHKDIFPTLYELSLSDSKYLNLGGKNMLFKATNPKLEFGINVEFYIDNDKVYNTYGVFNLHKNHLKNDGLVFDGFEIFTKNDTQSFADDEVVEFFNTYKKIYADETNYRIGKNYDENALMK